MTVMKMMVIVPYDNYEGDGNGAENANDGGNDNNGKTSRTSCYRNWVRIKGQINEPNFRYFFFSIKCVH